MNHLRQRFGTATRRPYTVRPGNAVLPFALRNREEPADVISLDPLGRDVRMARLEAAFMLADEPLTIRRIVDVVGLENAAEARVVIDQLKDRLERGGSAFQIEEIAGGYQFLTRPEYHPWLTRLRRTGHELRLTSAALETLAVIAYKQPIMRADVEKIRGVACAELIRHLMEKGLVRIAGRHDSLGRPQLYGTTKQFLQAFGLNTLKDLPEVDALRNPG